MMKFFDQCDRYRTHYENGEAGWHEMVSKAKPIEREKFERVADLSRLLDEGETLDQFMASDPESRVCVSEIKNEKVMFIETCGFEFIFTKSGKAPGGDVKIAPERDGFEM